jgi:hypothetical protein
MIAAAQAGERDGARWRAAHPTATPTLGDVVSGWLASGVADDFGRSETARDAAMSSASWESYIAAWRRGAGLDP